jgi:multicomponent Na+:H+ antiporter subunit G
MKISEAVFVLLVISGIFSVLGSIGLIRLPDFYTRTHAATIITMGGMCLALFALMIQTFWGVFTAKLMLIIIISLFASPTATHAIANLAYRKGVKPKRLVKNEWNAKSVKSAERRLRK